MRPMFFSSQAPAALAAQAEAVALWGQRAYAEADVLVAIGGDGTMIETLHRANPRRLPIYGLHRGTVGFLMNHDGGDGLATLADRVAAAVSHRLAPIEAIVTDGAGNTHRLLAFNEVSVLRAGPRAAHLSISVDGIERLDRLMGDGALLATPAGSTAYNASIQGPILPLEAGVLALGGIAVYRPRRWRGALLPHQATVAFTVLDADQRPVMANADSTSVPDARAIVMRLAPEEAQTVLFDPGSSLADRLLAEQFL